MTRLLAPLKPWRQSYDWFCIAYLLLTGLLPLLNPSCFEQVSQPGPLHAPWPHLGLHLLMSAAVFVVPPLLRSRPQWPLRLLGVIYLPMLLPYLYSELEFLGVVFFPYGHSFDPQLIALEQRIFGFQPSLEWSRAWPWAWLLELMQFAYFSYYYIGALTLVLIWTAGRRTPARNWALSAVLTRDLAAVMLSCYVWFVFFPVWGPKYFAYQGVAGTIASEGLRGWLFDAIMGWLHANAALHGAAFPSSHVAGSLVAWWWGWRLAPQHRWWLTGLWTLLGLSIVYCRYHYAVDLAAGIAWGALVVWLVNRFLPMPAEGLRTAPSPPAALRPVLVRPAQITELPTPVPAPQANAETETPVETPAGWRAQAANAMPARDSRPRSA